MARKQDRSSRARTLRTSTPTGTLRIIGGTLRGRPIAYSGDARTRPMKQRVREAAFNLLGPRVTGSHVIDLFAGTGALTWEAVSRGARSGTLIERHFPTARLVRENADALGLADRIQLVTGDAFVWARRLEAEPAESLPAGPWLVFCAPPYDLYVSAAEPMRELLARVAARAPRDSVLVVEADVRFDATLLPVSYTWDVRTYSPAVIAIGERIQEDRLPAPR